MKIPDKDVEQLELKFDASKLLTEYSNISNKFPNINQLNVISYENIKGDDQFTFGSGSLYDKNQQKFVFQYNKFNNLIEYYKNSYTEEIILQVKEYIGEKYKIGRVRWMCLLPKSTLSYHVDESNTFRLHVPIITTDNAFFIVNDVVWKMNSTGYLYFLNTQKRHTAVNTDNKKRVHLLFDVYN